MRAATQRLLDKRCSTQLRTRFACRCRLRHAVARGWSTLAPSTITRDREESPDGTYAAAEAGVMTGPAAGRPGDRARPKVFLHIGEPKTGTTFLQQVMWGNRAGLAAQGVVLPGHHAQDHYRASQDLRGMQMLASDPAGSWTGEWEILARQARQAPKAAVISHELFCAADAEQAERAVQVAAAGRRARRPHRAGHGDAAARRVAGDGEAPQRPRLGRLARRRDRPGVAGPTGAGGGSGACTTRWPSSTSGRGTCRPSGYT